MSKGKAVASAILSTVFALLCLWAQLGPCTMSFVFAALVFALIACYKQYRDAKIIEAAKQEQIVAAQRPQLPPPMASKGSSRLFAPPPLKERR